MNLKLAMSIAGLALVAAVPVVAHHSVAAEFDSSKRVTIKGTVANVEWMTPHIWIYVDVKDEAGKVTKWQCEGGPPNTLSRNGWTRNALKVGDEVTISGLLAKDKANTCNSQNVTLPDGKRVFAGSPEQDVPAPKGKQ